MTKERKAGVLLPISSLPAPYGIGTMGESAYRFIDWLKEAGMKLWQVLPLLPTNYGDSPYQSCASDALNYYFIDLDAATLSTYCLGVTPAAFALSSIFWPCSSVPV